MTEPITWEKKSHHTLTLEKGGKVVDKRENMSRGDHDTPAKFGVWTLNVPEAGFQLRSWNREGTNATGESDNGTCRGRVSLAEYHARGFRAVFRVEKL